MAGREARSRIGAPVAALVLGLSLVPAWGQVYRCTENGRAVFQDSPCAQVRPSPPPVPRPVDEGRWPYGCYELHANGSGASAGATERFRILAEGGRPRLAFLEKGGKGERLSLRPASAAELEAVGGAGRVSFDDGYVLSEFADKGDRPLGVYRQGKILFGFFFVANGPVTRVDCKGW